MLTFVAADDDADEDVDDEAVAAGIFRMTGPFYKVRSVGGKELCPSYASNGVTCALTNSLFTLARRKWTKKMQPLMSSSFG